MIFNKISVCLFSKNPEQDSFLKVIQGLKFQSLPTDKWNIKIIDNDSDESIERSYSGHFAFHPDVKFIAEKKRGLFFAQQCAVRSGDGDLIVILGDDCVLERDYLEKALDYMNSHPETGYMVGNHVLKIDENSKESEKYLLKLLYHADCHPEIFVQAVDAKRYTPAIRGSCGAVITREIAGRFTANDFYVDLLNLLRKYGIDKLRGTDLDLPMISLSIGRKIVMSSELCYVDIENSRGVNFGAYIERIVEEGFFNELFEHRWSWTSDSALSNIYYSGLGVYRAGKIAGKVNLAIRLLGAMKFYYLTARDKDIAFINKKIAAHFKKDKELK